MDQKLKIAFIYQKEYFEYHFDEHVCTDKFHFRQFYITSQVMWEIDETYEEAINFKADINIIIRGECVPTHIAKKFSGIKVAISTEPFPKIINNQFNYTLDSINRLKYFLNVFDKNFDYIFHYDQASESFLRGQGIELSGYFPLPIADQTYKPFQTEEKKWDICFIGRSTPHREELLRPIKHTFKVLHITHGLCGRELLDYINLSKINLNLHAEAEISWEPRLQLLLACETVAISEVISPNDYLIAGKHYLEIQRKEELLPLCETILKNYEKFDNIKKMGRLQVSKCLSSYNNFDTLIQNILNKKYSKPLFNKSKLDLATLEICKEYKGFEHLLAEIISNYPT